MKRMKKIIGLLMALVMVMSLALPAFAEETGDKTITITIKDGAKDATFDAFRMLNLTTSADGQNFSYTVNPKYRDALKAATGKTTDEDIIKYISEQNTADKTRAFADEMFKQIKAKNLAFDKQAKGNEQGKVIFENMPQGYYLFAESKNGEQPDSTSLVIVNTQGKDNLTVDSKENVPTVEKKVKEKNDSTGTESGWQDAADYDVNDKIPYKLTGTLPSNFDNYTSYSYIFHDTFSEGLTIDANDVKVHLNTEDGTDITSYFDVKVVGQELTVTAKNGNIKNIPTITKDSKIVVLYSATLNDKAKMGKPGNPNEVYLEFSNNPYDSGEGKPTGKTPKDKVTVFTFKIVVNKVKGDNNPLAGAGFTLYKFDKTANDYKPVGQELKGVTTFNFERLDAGKYKIVETTVPDGYNKAKDIEFTVTATYDTDSPDPQLTNLVVDPADGFTIQLEAGSVTTNVVNNSGNELPSTGGVGTTLFYVIGGMMMIGAGVLLVAKKRMHSMR